MRVVLQTETELKIHESGFWGWTLGSILILAGGGTIYLGWQNWLAGGALGKGSTFAPFFVGALFVIVGIIVFFVNRKMTHYFDCRRGTLTVIERGLSGVSRREYNLANIADAVLEETVSEDRHGDDPPIIGYRAAYVLKTGERVPWTTYFNGVRQDKEICIKAARDFLRVND